MLFISRLYIYPIKSLAGIACDAVQVTDRGFEHDRRWMLTDENGRFISQREHARMALLQVSIHPNGLTVAVKNDPANQLAIPFGPYTNAPVQVQVWESELEAIPVSPDCDAWFSQQLGFNCRLVYMKDEQHRLIDPAYNIGNRLTSFSDGYPILAISEASMEDLNQRCSEPIQMERFRPNLVIGGSHAYMEDEMKQFTINNISFFAVKPCARCVITTIHPDTATKGKEPLATLAAYRNRNNKIYFGQNIIAIGTGLIATKDAIQINETQPPLFPLSS